MSNKNLKIVILTLFIFSTRYHLASANQDSVWIYAGQTDNSNSIVKYNVAQIKRVHPDVLSTELSFSRSIKSTVKWLFSDTTEEVILTGNFYCNEQKIIITHESKRAFNGEITQFENTKNEIIAVKKGSLLGSVLNEVCEYKEPKSKYIIEAMVLHDKSWNLFEKKEYRDALKLVDKSVNNARKAFPTQDPRILQWLFNQAKMYYESGETTKSEPIFKEIITISQKNKITPPINSNFKHFVPVDSDYTADSKTHLFKILYNTDRADQADKLLAGSPYLGQLQNSFVSDLNEQGQFNKAIKYGHRQLKTALKLNNSETIYMAYFQLAKAYYKTKQINEAKNCARKALEISKEGWGFNFLQDILNEEQ